MSAARTPISAAQPAMRYVTATIGAIFVFAVVFLLCATCCAVVLPWNINHLKITIHLGWFYVWASPSVLIGGPLALAAAILTFRGALRVYRELDSDPPEKKLAVADKPALPIPVPATKTNRGPTALFIAASLIELLIAPIAYHVGDRLFGSAGGRLICFAMVQLIGFVLFWIGLYRRFDRDIGKAMFLALFATLGLLPVSVFMIFAIPVLGVRGFYIGISAH